MRLATSLKSFIDQLKEEGKIPLDQILVKASGMRLRAVLVTSLTTISGLVPTAYGIGGSDAMLVPMTLAMAWGAARWRLRFYKGFRRKMCTTMFTAS